MNLRQNLTKSHSAEVRRCGVGQQTEYFSNFYYKTSQRILARSISPALKFNLALPQAACTNLSLISNNTKAVNRALFFGGFPKDGAVLVDSVVRGPVSQVA